MKKYILPSLKLTLILLIIFSGLYPLLIAGIGKLAPGEGRGETVISNGKIVGYVKIGQRFTDDKYFTGRPSAVDYNAAGSGGSNKGPSNPDYLLTVKVRIDTFLIHNPGVNKNEIPVELVTASGSGLDPDISVAAAKVQAPRIAHCRNVQLSSILNLIDKYTETNLPGPQTVNVLKINVELDKLGERFKYNENKSDLKE